MQHQSREDRTCRDWKRRSALIDRKKQNRYNLIQRKILCLLTAGVPENK